MFYFYFDSLSLRVLERPLIIIIIIIISLLIIIIIIIIIKQYNNNLVVFIFLSVSNDYCAVVGLL